MRRASPPRRPCGDTSLGDLQIVRFDGFTLGRRLAPPLRLGLGLQAVLFNLFGRIVLEIIQRRAARPGSAELRAFKAIWKLTGARTGGLVGFSPLRIRSTKDAERRVMSALLVP
jgi:hypothetical protein